MAKKKQLILVVSDLMSSNKKRSRGEPQLVRMSEVARQHMDFENDKVELYPSDTNASKRLKGAMLLDIYKAYSKDLKNLKKKNLSEDELKRVGFVTEATFRRIVGDGDTGKDVWISSDINDGVLGADPEFLFRDNDNSVIYANSLLPFTGVLGSDGAMAEIRPAPSITPKEFVATVTDIFSEGVKIDNLKNLQWLAGCYYKDDNRSYPIGGHIHVGTPIQLVNGLEGSDLKCFFYCLNKILDEMVGVPLTKLDGVVRSKDRRAQFGYFGELRCDFNRLEYRSLSGTWLAHPKLTEAVTGTIKAIVNETYRHVMDNKINSVYVKHNECSFHTLYGDDFADWGNIGLTKDMGCVCPTLELKTKINKPCANDMKLEYVKVWYEKMKTLSTYNDYSECIDRLYDTLLLPLGVFRSFDMNLQHNWLEGASFAPRKNFTILK